MSQKQVDATTTGLREMNNVFCLEKFGGKMVVARPFVVGLNIVF